MSVAAPGSGWPEDPASTTTPVARSAEDVTRLSANAPTLDHIGARVSVCCACPRLVEWRERVAADKRASFRDEPYWGRPIPGWGDPAARILVLGLAPAAHGGNRTGRIFTGDRSGDWLFAALHRAGYAAQPTSVRAGDGQRLTDVRIAAAVRCAPPANKPTPEERDTCRPWLDAELTFMRPRLRAIVVLGGFAWAALWPALAAAGIAPPARRPAFGHRRELILDGAANPGGVPAGRLLVLGCYHPSQQNTFTGRLTEPMLDEVFDRVSGFVAFDETDLSPTDLGS